MGPILEKEHQFFLDQSEADIRALDQSEASGYFINSAEADSCKPDVDIVTREKYNQKKTRQHEQHFSILPPPPAQPEQHNTLDWDI